MNGQPGLPAGSDTRASAGPAVQSETGHREPNYGCRPTAPLLAKEGTPPPAHKHPTPRALSSSSITLGLLLLVPCSHRCRQTSPWARICQSPPPRAWASLKAQMVKNLPAMQETGVGSLGGEDPLEWHPTPVSLPGESHGQRGLAGNSPWGHRRVGQDLATK